MSHRSPGASSCRSSSTMHTGSGARAHSSSISRSSSSSSPASGYDSAPSAPSSRAARCSTLASPASIRSVTSRPSSGPPAARACSISVVLPNPAPATTAVTGRAHRLWTFASRRGRTRTASGRQPGSFLTSRLCPGARVHSAFGVLHQGRELRTGRVETRFRVGGRITTGPEAGSGQGDPTSTAPPMPRVLAPAHIAFHGTFHGTFHGRPVTDRCSSGRSPDDTCAIYGFASRMRQVVRPQP